MIQLIDRYGIFPKIKKKYLIDTSSELSELETTFGNEAYCITEKKTYICDGTGTYVEKESGSGGGGDIDLIRGVFDSNGTYTPPSGKAYNEVQVDTPEAPSLETLHVTENGTYTPPSGCAYERVNVDVAPSLGPVFITSNGSYDVIDHTTAEVLVTPNLMSDTFTENGIYRVPDGFDGYGEITVDVPYKTAQVSLRYNDTDIPQGVSVKCSIPYLSGYIVATEATISRNSTNVINVVLSDSNTAAAKVIDEGWKWNIISGNVTYRDATQKAITINGECVITAVPEVGYKSKLVQIVDGSVTELTEADLSGISRITPGAFYNRSNLTSITIPSSVMSIGYQAFYGCTGLTSIIIPSGVTSIASYCFYGCNGLTSITIPSGVTVIDRNAFSGCTRLTNIIIPSGVTLIPDYCFDDCSGLTSIIIPSGVTSIGLYAFGGCTGLTSIIIPSGVTSIGNRAFNSCANLERITVEAVSPPHLGNANAFEGTSANLIIYVPAASVDAYKAAVSWSELADRIQAIPTT